MKTCPQCGTEYPDDANFCNRDAARLEAKAAAQNVPTRGWTKFMDPVKERPPEPAASAAPAAPPAAPNVPTRGWTQFMDPVKEPPSEPAVAAAPEPVPEAAPGPAPSPRASTQFLSQLQAPKAAPPALESAPKVEVAPEEPRRAVVPDGDLSDEELAQFKGSSKAPIVAVVVGIVLAAVAFFFLR